MVSKKYFRSRNNKHPKMSMSIIVFVIAAAVLTVLELTGTTYLLHKRPVTEHISSTPIQPISMTNSVTQQPAPTTNSAPQQPAPTSQNTKVVTNSGPSSSSSGTNSELITPYGTLVSNHYPGKNGTPTSEESTCQTTPYADCYMEFVQGAVAKTLSTQKTDSTGVTSWNWDVNQDGFTSGSWKITAIASVNGQTKSTTDPLALEVQ